jgi:hypothetical protein
VGPELYQRLTSGEESSAYETWKGQLLKTGEDHFVGSARDKWMFVRLSTRYMLEIKLAPGLLLK